MSEISVNGAARAIEHDGQSATENIIACQTASEPSDWFGDLARPLLIDTDAGFALHLLTGLLPNTCARYVAKTESSRRQPPGYFIRALLRSEQGGIWLRAFMDGCEPKWWREQQSAEQKAELVERIRALVGPT